MVAYNFQKQFADAVSSGKKSQTIRAARKSRHACEGERIQLYTGMRHKSCRKLISPDPVCTYSGPITIRDDGYDVGLTLKPSADDFAKLDGFGSWADLRKWFENTHGLPFSGTLIMWENS